MLMEYGLFEFGNGTPFLQPLDYYHNTSEPLQSCMPRRVKNHQFFVSSRFHSCMVHVARSFRRVPRHTREPPPYRPRASVRLIGSKQPEIEMQVDIKDGKMVITIDVSKAALDAAQPSKSGKTRIVATTNGFTNYGPIGLSLNATVK